MTVHMVVEVEKTGSDRAVTVRCGTVLRVAGDDPLHYYATVWESRVTCSLCGGAPKLETYPLEMF